MIEDENFDAETDAVKIQALRQEIDGSGNRILTSDGPFVLLEVCDATKIERIRNSEKYAVICLEDEFIENLGLLGAVATGNQHGRGYEFQLTFSHMPVVFTCANLEDVPRRTFLAIERYFKSIR